MQCNGSGTCHLDVHMRDYGFGGTGTGATVQIFRSGGPKCRFKVSGCNCSNRK